MKELLSGKNVMVILPTGFVIGLMYTRFTSAKK